MRLFSGIFWIRCIIVITLRNINYSEIKCAERTSQFLQVKGDKYDFCVRMQELPSTNATELSWIRWAMKFANTAIRLSLILLHQMKIKKSVNENNHASYSLLPNFFLVLYHELHTSVILSAVHTLSQKLKLKRWSYGGWEYCILIIDAQFFRQQLLTGLRYTRQQ